MFVVRCLLLFVVVLFDLCWSLCVVCCLSFVVRCALVVVCYLLFVVWCLLLDV